MAGISSKAAGGIKNNDETFQGQKFDDGLGLSWVEFKYRNHDPQTGRFIEIDPLSDKYVYNSTYAFSENHVTTYIGLEGLEKHAVNPETTRNTALVNSYTNQKMLEAARSGRFTTTSTSGGPYLTEPFLALNRFNQVEEQTTGNVPIRTDFTLSASLASQSSGLQIVQVAISPPNSNVQQLSIDGVSKTAFVDGGKYSPSRESVTGKPYYNTAGDLADVLYAKYSWNSSNNNITIHDIPTAASQFTQFNFETYFVATGWQGRGRGI